MSAESPFSFDLYPDVDAELEASYKANHDAPKSGNDNRLPDALAEQVGLHAANKGAFQMPEYGAAVERAVESAELYASGMSGSGVDALVHAAEDVQQPGRFPRVEEAYRAMTRLGLEPQLALVPDQASSFNWHHILNKLPRPARLDVNKNVEKHWDELRPSTDSLWSLAAVATLPSPIRLSMSHDLRHLDDNARAVFSEIYGRGLGISELVDIRSSYPTINEYIAVQAACLYNSQEPLDGKTWLYGSYANSDSAPVGNWDTSIDDIYITARLSSEKYNSMRLRPTVREVVI